MDIKESKELLTFLARFGSAIDKSLADGKINFLDIGTIFDPLIVAKAAFEDVNKIPSELADLSNEEAAELVTLVEQFHFSPNTPLIVAIRNFQTFQKSQPKIYYSHRH